MTQLPFLTNLVHPTGAADAVRIRGLARLTKPKALASEGRRAEADARSALLSVNAWDVYPAYFRENPSYKLAAEFQHVGAGTNYLDLGISYAKFQQQTTGGLYVVIGDRVAQYFVTYAAAASGSNTRLTGVMPTAAMQAAAQGQSVQIYLNNTIKLIANDSYVNGLAIVAKEYLDVGIITSAGAGYIDISIPGTAGRLSSKYAAGLNNGVLVVGGTIMATLALSAASQITRSGTTSQRAIRISIAGTYTTYIGQPAAITFADDKPSPKVWERVVMPWCALPLAAMGARGFLSCDVPMLDGVTFNVNVVGPKIAAIQTVDIYSLSFDVRTLLGTISIAANGASGTLASGNPATAIAGQTWEAVCTSASTSATTSLIVTAVPN